MAKISRTKFRKAVEGSEGILTSVAERMQVSRQSLYAWLEKNPGERKFLVQETENVLDIAESKLFSAVENGENWAIKYLLSTKGKVRGYSDKIKIEDSSEGSSYWTPEEKEKEIARLLGKKISDTYKECYG
jgi:hypothetical protein